MEEEEEFINGDDQKLEFSDVIEEGDYLITVLTVCIVVKGNDKIEAVKNAVKEVKKIKNLSYFEIDRNDVVKREEIKKIFSW